MLRNYIKKPKVQYDDKEIQHDLQLVNYGASIQVELGLSIAEIYDQVILRYNIKVSVSLCSCHLTIEYIFWHPFESDSLCPGFLRVFCVALGLIQKTIVKAISN